MNRRLRGMLFTLLAVALCLLLGACAILGQAKFGKHPQGERLEWAQASSNYKNGEFHSTVPTATRAEGQSTMIPAGHSST